MSHSAYRYQYWNWSQPQPSQTSSCRKWSGMMRKLSVTPIQDKQIGFRHKITKSERPRSPYFNQRSPSHSPVRVKRPRLSPYDSRRKHTTSVGRMVASPYKSYMARGMSSFFPLAFDDEAAPSSSYISTPGVVSKTRSVSQIFSPKLFRLPTPSRGPKGHNSNQLSLDTLLIRNQLAVEREYFVTENRPPTFETDLLKLNQVYEGHRNTVNTMIMHNDWLLTGSSDYCVRNWITGNVCRAHKRAVTGLAEINMDSYVTVSDDCSAKLWTSTNTLTQTIYKGRSQIKAVISPSPIILITGSDTAQVWDLESCKRLQVFDEHHSALKCLEFYQLSNFFSGSLDSSIKLWDLRQRRSVASFQGHKDVVTSISLIDDFSFLSGSLDTEIRRWDIRTCLSLSKMKQPDPVRWVGRVSGKTVSAGRSINIWSNQNDYANVSYHGGSVRSILSDRDMLYTGSHDGEIAQWMLKW